MLHQWNIRSRAHHCAVTERPFEDGEKHYTAIYFDPKAGEYTRRDVSLDAWEQELSERKPFSFWKSIYEKTAPGGKAEIAPKEDALTMLQRLIEEGNPYTENARYILAAMLERKRVLAPKDRKETEEGIMLIYENKKTGEIYIVRDPELRLDEVAGVQDEVATLLGFGGPVVEAAKVAGIEIGPDGKIIRRKGDKKKGEAAKAEPAAAAQVAAVAQTTETSSTETTTEATVSEASSDESSSESQASEATQDVAESEESTEEDETEDLDEEDEDFDDEEDDDLEEDDTAEDEEESVAVEEEDEDEEDLDEADDEEDDASEDEGESVLIEEDEDEDDLDDEDEEEAADEDEGESVMIEEEPEEEDAK